MPELRNDFHTGRPVLRVSVSGRNFDIPVDAAPEEMEKWLQNVVDLHAREAVERHQEKLRQLLGAVSHAEAQGFH